VIYEGLVEAFSRKVGKLEYRSNPLVLDTDLGSWRSGEIFEGGRCVEMAAHLSLTAVLPGQLSGGASVVWLPCHIAIIERANLPDTIS